MKRKFLMSYLFKVFTKNGATKRGDKMLGYIIIAIIFLFFNIITFVIPTDKTLTFWISYVFTDIAFIAQIFIWKSLLNSLESSMRTFVSLLMVCIGLGYLIVQVIAFAIFMAFPTIPSWISIISCLLIIGISTICILALDIYKLMFKQTGCYVATAVYGSYDCPEVWTLRRYRDYILAKTWYGCTFIHIYYAISPTIVKWFGHTEWFKKIWKRKLDRMVSNLQAKGVEDTPYEDRVW